MALCNEKHIEIPIPNEEWLCPKCGAGDGDFFIDYEGEPCDGNHPNDQVVCYKCDGSWTLKAIISKWAKKKALVACHACKGSGVLDSTKLPSLEDAIKVFHDAYLKDRRMNAGIEAVWQLLHPEEKHV